MRSVLFWSLSISQVVIFQPSPPHLRRQANVTVTNASTETGLFLRKYRDKDPQYFRPVGTIIEADTEKKVEEGIVEYNRLWDAIHAWEDSPFNAERIEAKNGLRRTISLYKDTRGEV